MVLISPKVRESLFSGEVITMLPGEIVIPFITIIMFCAIQKVHTSNFLNAC